MHTHSIAYGRLFLPFINPDKLNALIHPTHTSKGAPRFRCRMPASTTRVTAQHLVPPGCRKNHGVVLSEEEKQFEGRVIDSTYHYTFVIPIGDVSKGQFGNVRNAYVYNDKLYVAVWKSDYKQIALPEISEDSFNVGKNAFK